MILSWLMGLLVLCLGNVVIQLTQSLASFDSLYVPNFFNLLSMSQ